MLLLSDTYSMVPILVHEFQPHACNQEPEMLLQRARLYRVLLPPDQLNSFGYYDGTLDAAFLSRYDRKKKGGRADLRASTKQMTMPPPGELAALLLCHLPQVCPAPCCRLPLQAPCPPPPRSPSAAPPCCAYLSLPPLRSPTHLSGPLPCPLSAAPAPAPAPTCTPAVYTGPILPAFFPNFQSPPHSASQPLVTWPLLHESAAM